MNCHNRAPNAFPSIRTSVLNETLDAAELALFARVGQRCVYRAGQTVFRRGDIATQIYICVSGDIALELNDDVPAKRMGPGDWFGELGLALDGYTRLLTATVVADCELIVLDNVQISALIERYPELMTRFLRRSIARVVCNEEVMIDELRHRNHQLAQVVRELNWAARELQRTMILIGVDELTGLQNRRGLINYLQRCHLEQRSPGTGLLLLDCDHFKQVNDRHGHQAGDRVLRNLASVLKTTLGESDLVCRLGGDEFCVLVDVDGQAQLLALGERILSEVRRLLSVQGTTPLICTISIGICQIDGFGSWNSWYANADRALYQAKHLGGNRLQLYDAAVLPAVGDAKVINAGGCAPVSPPAPVR